MRESTSIRQEDKDKFKVCITVDYMSSEESLSEPESLNHQEDDSSGSDFRFREFVKESPLYKASPLEE